MKYVSPVLAQKPLGLVDVLRDYGVREFGAFFIYLPMPKVHAHQEAWAWFEAISLFDVVSGGPWRINTVDTQDWLRNSHPDLFSKETIYFEVYRLDRERIAALFDRISV